LSQLTSEPAKGSQPGARPPFSQISVPGPWPKTKKAAAATSTSASALE
jgi:hypothetical protein